MQEARGLKIVDGDGEWIGGDSEEKLVHAEGRAKDGKWEAKHLWRFERVEGETKHTRRVWVENEEAEEARVKMVYDLEG